MEQPLFEDPFEWFDAWYDEAKAAGMTDPNAMTLATVGADGMPSARVVLLKEHDAEQGFVFYTNLESQKGTELRAHPKVSLSFFWRDMGRQIRIEGKASQVPDEQADAYYASRPRLSRIGAWASSQSRPLESRQTLADRVAELEAQYPEGADIPRPPHWSGVAVVPTRIEFWQAGDFRLHDRFTFQRSGDGWTITRLNP